MRNLSGFLFAMIVIVSSSCQPETESFITVDLKDNAILYVDEINSISLETSEDVKAVTFSFKDSLEWKADLVECEGEVEVVPISIGDKLALHITGFDKSMNEVVKKEIKVNVLQNPIVDIQWPVEGQVITVGEEILFKGSFDINIRSVEVMLKDEMIAQMSSSPFNQSFSFERGKGELSLTFAFKDERGRIIKRVIRKISLLNIQADGSDYFPLDEPITGDLGASKNLWATYYYLHQAQAVENGLPLRNMNNQKIGPLLDRKDWCYSAMEGSVHVTKLDGTEETYNYAGTTNSFNIDCSSYFSHKLGKTKFAKAKGAFGDGVRGYKLNPFRTIAVDRNNIAYGKVVYIPSARGDEIKLPDGSIAYHDGYFFAGDTGGAIKNKHVDVFIGTAKRNPFSWVTSRASGSFKAYIVKNPDVIKYLTELH